jgi:glutamate-ammonia-ligase adenylyltransferase
MSAPQDIVPPVSDPDRMSELIAIFNSIEGDTQFDQKATALAEAVFGNSPFLMSLAKRHSNIAKAALVHDPEPMFQSLLSGMKEPRSPSETDDDFMAYLRREKNQVSLLVAIADIAGYWPLMKITEYLSNFADASLRLALARSLYKRRLIGDLAWPNDKDANSDVCFDDGDDCGYFLLGMGKLGSNELNYSSDIDLIALYDPALVTYQGRKSISDCFIKITQDIVRFIDMRTMYGYVFRVDLRLRPDPSATPVALSVDAARSYYHSLAANWERAAMIKARLVAGDKAAGHDYLEDMASWIWRRNMDFEALRDIAGIKNQINRHYSTNDISFRGFDVKLGVGGIREIEFFAQVNQLLHGGRQPSLRVKPTLEVIRELVTLKHLDSSSANDLCNAYHYLRQVEHRIQMTNDEQSHQIPEDAAPLNRLTAFMGYKKSSDFQAELEFHTRKVSQHFDSLLPGVSDEVPIVTRDQITRTLHKAGIEQIDASIALIESWQNGRHRCLKAARSRELLNLCLPDLLTAFADTNYPEAALTRFDSFLGQLHAGVQFFSLLRSNPALFRLLARVMGLAPALANILAKSPGLWDSVLDQGFFEPIKNKTEINEDFSLLLSTARDYQDTLDIARRFWAEQKFRTGVQMLEGLAKADEIGIGLSLVADTILQKLIHAVEDDFAEKHGRFKGVNSGITMIALGKYGGNELTHTSDIDVVFLYETNEDGAYSDGTKPLSANVYYIRLVQHILTAITALTPEGRLFEVDTRLRPSGAQGPLAVAISTFEDYYRTSAWTWEFLALTRSRVVYGPERISAQITRLIKTILQRDPNAKTLTLDTLAMRQKLHDQFSTKSAWEVKYTKGGLVDVEFICQYLSLKHAKEKPAILQANVIECLQALQECNILSREDADRLANAFNLMRYIQSILRLCLEDVPKSAADIPIGLQQVMVDGTDFTDFEALKKGLAATQRDCYALYNKIIIVDD